MRRTRRTRVADARDFCGAARLSRPGAEERLSEQVGGLLDAQVDLLRGRMAAAIGEVGARLRAEHAAMLRREHERWASTTGWQLINAADPCGT